VVETVHTGEHQTLEEIPEVHALDRLEAGYDLEEVSHEYALLRGFILRLYEAHAETVEAGELGVMPREVRRFNQTFDVAVRAAVSCYARTRERTLVALDRLSAAAVWPSIIRSARHSWKKSECADGSRCASRSNAPPRWGHDPPLPGAHGREGRPLQEPPGWSVRTPRQHACLHQGAQLPLGQEAARGTFTLELWNQEGCARGEFFDGVMFP
jgi:hypothetical protein